MLIRRRCLIPSQPAKRDSPEPFDLVLVGVQREWWLHEIAATDYADEPSGFRIFDNRQTFQPMNGEADGDYTTGFFRQGHDGNVDAEQITYQFCLAKDLSGGHRIEVDHANEFFTLDHGISTMTLVQSKVSL